MQYTVFTNSLKEQPNEMCKEYKMSETTILTYMLPDLNSSRLQIYLDTLVY